MLTLRDGETRRRSWGTSGWGRGLQLHRDRRGDQRRGWSAWRGGRLALGVGLIALGQWFSAPAAMAQSNDEWHYGGYQTSNEMMAMGFVSPRPPYTRAMLSAAIDRLGLDEGQDETVRSLYDAFEREFQTAWLAQAERASDSRSASMMGGDWVEFERKNEEEERANREKMKKLVDSFLLDFELMLNPDQTEIWEAIERDKNRSTHLAMAADNRYAPVDLGTVLRGLSLDEAQRKSFDPIIARYHDEIDAVLVPAVRQAERVQTMAREAQEKQRALSQLYQGDGAPSESDVEKAQAENKAASDRVRDAALELNRMYNNVRTAHRRFVEEVRRELPAAHHEAYDKATAARASGNEFNWDSYSRFNMAVQMLERIEQTRSMMELQAAMMSDQMTEEQGEMFREMTLIMRRAKPLSQQQKRDVERIKADYKQRTESLEAEARRKATEARQAAEQNSLTIRLPVGSVHLYKMNESGGRTWWGGHEDSDQVEQRQKRARMDQDAIDELRLVLDFYQRAMIANF